MNPFSLTLIALGLSASLALAGDRFEIRPRIFDLNPRDGLLDPGSFANPYELHGPRGRLGEIRPRVFDLNLRDGFMDPRSFTNP
jgi:hypothetical protein